MKQAWQRFLGLVGDDPEAAGMSLLVLAVAVVTSTGLFVYCMVTSKYAAAAGLVAGSGVVTSVCVRDYRRGRWSFESGVAVVVWLLLSGAALAYGCWVSYGRG